MKFIRLFFLLSLALGFVAAQAQVSSEPVEAPKFVGGENWEYRTTPKSFNDCNPNRPYNTKVSIESIDESGINAKNGRLTVKMNLGLDEIQDVDGVSNIRRTFNFPMVPGKKWEQRMMDNISSGVLQTDLSCEHGKFEKVTVPAGEFDAVHIVCKGRWNNLTARDGLQKSAP